MSDASPRPGGYATVPIPCCGALQLSWEPGTRAARAGIKAAVGQSGTTSVPFLDGCRQQKGCPRSWAWGENCAAQCCLPRRHSMQALNRPFIHTLQASYTLHGTARDGMGSHPHPAAGVRLLPPRCWPWCQHRMCMLCPHRADSPGESRQGEP